MGHWPRRRMVGCDDSIPDDEPKRLGHPRRPPDDGRNQYPKLDLPPRVRLQIASKFKQIWEIWSTMWRLRPRLGVIFQFSIGNGSMETQKRDVKNGANLACRSATPIKEVYLYGRKCPIPSSCGTFEALLRTELLDHQPEWLSKKQLYEDACPGMLSCS